MLHMHVDDHLIAAGDAMRCAHAWINSSASLVVCYVEQLVLGRSVPYGERQIFVTTPRIATRARKPSYITSNSEPSGIAE
jgi:hypothetical protein